MKATSKGTVVLQTSDQLAALLKSCAKTGLECNLESSFEYHYLLYQAIEEEKVSPSWFITEKLHSDLHDLLKGLESQSKTLEQPEVEEQIQTVRFFIGEVESWKPKGDTSSDSKLYKASSELREILGSEWLVQKDLVSIGTLKNFISQQIQCRKLRTNGNKIYLDGYLQMVLETQQEYMFYDQILRKLKEGLLLST